MAECSPVFFRETLFRWHETIDRPMPWLGEKDPYRIWVSEIILQQTRVEQGLSYYIRFVEAFPTVSALAAASEAQLLKLWEGLGYYSRARNMLHAAQTIMRTHGGHFPTDYAAILALKGIGPYTAAAIASFAFELPYPVVDGNVERILSRIWGISEAIDTRIGKKQIHERAVELLDNTRPGKYNQAMMDFGALHCTPRKPDCPACPFRDYCVAFQENRIDALPVKTPKQAKTARFFHYLVFSFEGHTWVRGRVDKDIWAGLYEFPLLETSALELELGTLLEADLLRHNTAIIEVESITVSTVFRQTLSHQIIHARFWEIPLLGPPVFPKVYTFQRVARTGLSDLAFPRMLRWYLEEKNLSLNLF